MLNRPAKQDCLFLDKGNSIFPSDFHADPCHSNQCLLLSNVRPENANVNSVGKLRGFNLNY